jgi:molecular chaperone GrpE
MPEQRRREFEDAAEAQSPEPQRPSALLEDARSLRERAVVAETERDQYVALLKRSRADFDNYQKRSQRDLTDERRHAHGPFARDLLPVLDNLQRALDVARQQGEQGPLMKGVTLVESQLLDIFRRFGLTPINPQGQSFDPMLHEAVSQEPRADVAPGTVVLEPGYRLHERVLRPARVVVANRPANTAT